MWQAILYYCRHVRSDGIIKVGERRQQAHKSIITPIHQLELSPSLCLPWESWPLEPKPWARWVIDIGYQQHTEVYGLYGSAWMPLDCKINEGWQAGDLGCCCIKIELVCCCWCCFFLFPLLRQGYCCFTVPGFHRYSYITTLALTNIGINCTQFITSQIQSLDWFSRKWIIRGSRNKVRLAWIFRPDKTEQNLHYHCYLNDEKEYEKCCYRNLVCSYSVLLAAADN